MAGFSLAEFAALVALAGVLSFAVLWALQHVPPRSKRAYDIDPVNGHTRTVFLFDGDTLTDHDTRNHGSIAAIADWAGLRRWLAFRFSDLPDTLDPFPGPQPITRGSRDEDDQAVLHIVPDRGKTRVVLDDPCICDAADNHEALRMQTTLKEDSAAFQASPFAMWKTDLTGALVWRNPACAAIEAEVPEALTILSRRLADTDHVQQSRQVLDRPDGQPSMWLDVKCKSTGSGFIHYALDITATIKAEDAQRRFVQTLTKTFASLATGLAVFGRDQQLALFNPALIDLTGVSAEFLSARPTVISFFDTLRDRQVLPEPRNYANWRTQLQAMIKAASDGDYLETWSLPSGLTYRVTGRPHPDGAVAFLFEDITAEISLTRRFRRQIDLRQAVLDKLDEPVAVFGPDNILVFCNAAFRVLVGTDPDSAFADVSAADIARICRERFPDPAYWAKVADQRAGESFADILSGPLKATKGPAMRFSHRSVPGGALLIGTAASASAADSARTKPAA